MTNQTDTPTIAIVIADGQLPVIIEETDPRLLLAQLQGLAFAPDLPDLAAAKAWLTDQPDPAGLYADRTTAKAATARAARLANPPPEIKGPIVTETRKALGLSMTDFGVALGYTGKRGNISRALKRVEVGERSFSPRQAERFVKLRAEAGLRALDD